jgi:hypothetical protein
MHAFLEPDGIAGNNPLYYRRWIENPTNTDRLSRRLAYSPASAMIAGRIGPPPVAVTLSGETLDSSLGIAAILLIGFPIEG